MLTMQSLSSQFQSHELCSSHIYCLRHFDEQFFLTFSGGASGKHSPSFVYHSDGFWSRCDTNILDWTGCSRQIMEAEQYLHSWRLWTIRNNFISLCDDKAAPSRENSPSSSGECVDSQVRLSFDPQEQVPNEEPILSSTVFSRGCRTKLQGKI